MSIRLWQRLPVLGAATILALALMFTAGAAVERSDNCSASGGLACASMAPDFTLPQVPRANRVRLWGYHGRLVLLDFFATWCPHCWREEPILNRLYQANGKYGLVMLSILSDARDHTTESNPNPGKTSPADVLWFIHRFHIKHPVLFDPNVANYLTSEHSIYKLQAFPTLYLLDRKGIIRYSWAGDTSQKTLQAAINKLRL